MYPITILHIQFSFARNTKKQGKKLKTIQCLKYEFQLRNIIQLTNCHNELIPQ